MARRGEKQVHVWKYVDGMITYQVPVLMINTDEQNISDYDRNRMKDEGKPATFFRVRMANQFEVNDEDVNIDVLKARVFAAIKKQLVVEWTPVLLVIIEGERDRLFEKKFKPDTKQTRDNAKLRMEVEWKRYQVATVGGKPRYRQFEGFNQPYNTQTMKNEGPVTERWGNSCEGVPSHWKSDHDRKTVQSTVIPDTPENRAALETLADRLTEFRETLAKFLDDKTVKDTLAGLAAGSIMSQPFLEPRKLHLLPAPKEKHGKVEH